MRKIQESLNKNRKAFVKSKLLHNINIHVVLYRTIKKQVIKAIKNATHRTEHVNMIEGILSLTIAVKNLFTSHTINNTTNHFIT